MKPIILLLTILAFSFGTLVYSKTWTNNQGQTVDAELLQIHDLAIEIKTEKDGKTYFYNISSLSAKDQRFVQSIKKDLKAYQSAPLNERYKLRVTLLGSKFIWFWTILSLILNPVLLFLGAKMFGNEPYNVTLKSAYILSWIYAIFFNLLYYLIPTIVSYQVISFILVLFYWNSVSKVLTKGLFRALIVITLIGLIHTGCFILYQKTLMDEGTKFLMQSLSQIQRGQQFY